MVVLGGERLVGAIGRAVGAGLEAGVGAGVGTGAGWPWAVAVDGLWQMPLTGVAGAAGRGQRQAGVAAGVVLLAVAAAGGLRM